MLEKQSYMLIGRHDFETLMRQDPASACLSSSTLQVPQNVSDADIVEVEQKMSNLLLDLRPIKQVYFLILS